MRKATQLRMATGIAALAAISALGCLSGRSGKTSDSMRYRTTYVRPVPERGDERAGRVPSADSIGGPYSKFKVTGTVPNAATPGLPKALSAMTDAEIASYLQSLNFDMARDNGELARVRCALNPLGHCSVELYVEPEVGMRKRAFTDVPPFGMVVARIINYSSSGTDTTFQIPPLTRAYWYVFHGAGTSLRSRVFIRTPLDSQKVRLLGVESSYDSCDHAPYGGAAVARFRKCDGMTYETGMKSARTYSVDARVPNPFIHAVVYHPTSIVDRPANVAQDADALTATDLWIKCALGCCTKG